MGIFDTHAHYDDDAFDEDRDEVIKSLPAAGIDFVTDIGCDIESSRKVLELTKQYDFFYGTVGVIPGCVGDAKAEDLAEIEEIARDNEKIVAIGEIGLDYHYDDGPAEELQKQWFMDQMNLARKLNLPISVHSRDAAKDTIDIMKEAHAEEIGGVIHCYSYSWETAQEFMKMGFKFGIGGVVTFERSKRIKTVVKNVPLSSIVLETDCPYLAPVPKRGRRNQSSYLQYVAEKIAEIKEISVEEVIETTTQNAKELYQLN